MRWQDNKLKKCIGPRGNRTRAFWHEIQKCYHYTRVLHSNPYCLICLICLTYVLENCLSNTSRAPIHWQPGEGLTLYRGFYIDGVTSLYSFTFTLCPHRDYCSARKNLSFAPLYVYVKLKKFSKLNLKNLKRLCTHSFQEFIILKGASIGSRWEIWGCIKGMVAENDDDEKSKTQKSTRLVKE